MSRLARARHVLAILLLAVWWGGFTFYALVVVPTGHRILHSNVRQGFITQSVTNQLNGLGAVTLGVLAWQTLALRREDTVRRRFRIATVSWMVLAITLGALFWLHPYLDVLLDPANRSVTDEDHFYEWHRWYLIIASVQWLAGLVHLACVFAASPREDGPGEC